MPTRWRGVLAVAAVCGLAASVQAQFEMRMPKLRGVWEPAVGSGAVYQVDGKEGKSQMEYAVVGTETLAGKAGHWLEMSIEGKDDGQMIMKMLVVNEKNGLQFKRMIVQAPGEDAMEFPVEMMMRAGETSGSADFREEAVRVGTETITVPAGTFTCEHYRAKDNSGDVWVSPKVPPYGVVKSVSKEGTLTLVRVVSNAKSRIRGTPQKFDPMEMMRQRP